MKHLSYYISALKKGFKSRTILGIFHVIVKKFLRYFIFEAWKVMC